MNFLLVVVDQDVMWQKTIGLGKEKSKQHSKPGM
jgi:hypothetical protein